MINRVFYILIICWGLAFLPGCSSSMEYEAGLYTKTVKGLLTFKKADSSHQPFILVRDYHRTLLETSEGYLNRVTAFLIYPDGKGRYSVPFSTDTVKLELSYYAHNSQVKIQEFSRSIGIGSYNFNVLLEEDENWQKSYYLLIKPTLVEYITEKRYLMNQVDKYFIGEWLGAADERL